MGIVDEEAEVVFLFVGYNFVKCSEVAGHAEYTLGDDEYASACFFDNLLRMLQLLLEALHVIVGIYKPFRQDHPETVHYAGMRFGVIYNNVMSSGKAVNNGYHSLVTVIEEV